MNQLLGSKRRELAGRVLVGLLLAAPAGAWEVREEIRDGIPWVINPAAPRDGQCEIELKELWRLGDGEEEEEFFGRVIGVFEDAEQHICLLDAQLHELRLYTRAGTFVRTMGRMGEGPGEFQQAIDACWLPWGGYGVIQSWPGRLVAFQPNGDPGGTIIPQMSAGEGASYSFMVTYSAAPIGEYLGIVCMDQNFSQTIMKRTHMLGIFDREGNLVAPLLQSKDELDMSQGVPLNELGAASYRGRWAALASGEIAAVPAHHGYEIHFFDSAGTLLRVVTRDYETVMRTDEEIARINEVFASVAQTIPNAQIDIQEEIPDITTLNVGFDGNLWALSSTGQARRAAGVLGTYDVFDERGHFIHQVSLMAPGDPLEDGVVLLRDRVIVVRGLLATFAGGAEEDGAEEVTIICYEAGS